MTYLIVQLASCLFFAQLLGVLLGWLLWGFAAKQRAQEIALLRSRMAELASQQALRAAEEAQPRGSLLSARDFKKPAAIPYSPMADLPPLPALPPEPDEAAVKEKAQNEELIAGLREEVRALKEQLAQLSRQKAAEATEFQTLLAQQSDTHSQMEKAQNELLAARADFNTRSSWMTKRIHDLERAVEEMERTRQEHAHAVRAEVSKTHAEATAAQHGELQLRAAELADLRERLEKALSERDALTANAVETSHALSAAPAQLAEMQENLRGKDAQLAEQVARVENLLWRVAELEPFAKALPALQETTRNKDAEISALAAAQAERDSHIRTLLGRITELEPLNARVTEMKANLDAREASLTAAETHRQELEKTLETKQAELAGAEQAAADWRQRHADLDAAKTGEASQLHSEMQQLAEKHQAELTRVKVSSAQRVRRFRQSIAGFKN